MSLAVERTQPEHRGARSDSVVCTLVFALDLSLMVRRS
jgi:hypothetical protein